MITMLHQIITYQWPSIESLAKSIPAVCLTLVLFGPKCVPSHSSFFFLKLIWGNKHGDFGDVLPQLDSFLQLAHLHFSLQSGRALHGAHQHQLTCQTVWTLDCEVAPSLPSPQQGEAERVTYWTQCWDPEHDTRSRQVGHNSQVMVGERVWCLRTCFVVHWTGITFTAHGRCFHICSIRDFGAIHTDTLETTICVNAHLVLCAVVLSGGTLINVFTAAPITGHIISSRTGAAVSSRGVNTSM